MIDALYAKIDKGCPVALFLVESPNNTVLENIRRTKELRELINLYYFPIFKAEMSYDIENDRIEHESITFAYSSNDERHNDFINVCEYIGIKCKCKTILILYKNEVNILVTNEDGWNECKFREVYSLGKYSPRKIRSFLRLMGYENFSFEVTENVSPTYGGWSRCVYVTHCIIPELRNVTKNGEKYYDFIMRNKNENI